MHFRRAALLTALIVPQITIAQSIPGGPYAPSVLLFPSGARTLAMGNTGVAGRDDDVLFFNPAQLVVARGMSASWERYTGSMSGGALSSVTRFNTGGIAVGMRLLNYDAAFNAFPIDRDRRTPLSAGGLSVEGSVGIGQVFKGVRVGAAAKYAQDQVGDGNVDRAALDLGVSKDLFRYYTFGLAVQNIGRSMRVPCAVVIAPRDNDCITAASTPAFNESTSLRLPLRTTLGVSTSRALGEFDFVGTAAVSMLRTNFFLPSGGVELGYSWLDGYSVALRAGGRRSLPGEEGFTGGAGFTMDRLSIDYAMELLSHSRVGHRVGLRIR